MAKRPNVILIMTDQQKATSLPQYGKSPVEGSNLDRMCSTGVLYENGFTPHPLCVPARCALWTSRFPHNNGCRRNETLMKESSYHAFQFWKEHGFRTGLIGKNHCFTGYDVDHYFDLWLTASHVGLDKALPQKGEWSVDPAEVEKTYDSVHKRPDDNRNLQITVVDRPLNTHTTGLVGETTCQYLREFAKDSQTPFALWVSIPSPHEPYVVPREYYERFDPDAVELNDISEEQLKKMPVRMQRLHSMLNADGREDKLKRVVAAYYGNVQFVDDTIGKILDTLEETGLRQDTIVVFCSDHGDFSGEFNMSIKGGMFYDCLTHVPVALSYPAGIPDAQKVDSFVSLVDIVPTLLKLQGYEIPEQFQGHVMPLHTGEKGQDAAFSEYGFGFPLLTEEKYLDSQKDHPHYLALINTLRWREAEGFRKMVRTKEYKYVHDPLGDTDELYDLRKDPAEHENVIDDAAYGEVLLQMQRRLMDWSVQTENTIFVPGKDIPTKVQ